MDPANVSLKADRRRARVRRLRGEGLSIREIANQVRASPGTVHSDLQKGGEDPQPLAHIQDADGRPVAGAEANNRRAEKHGGHSPARVNPRAKELAEAATVAVPRLQDPEFAPSVRAWSRAEAAVELISEWLGDHGGPLDPDGVPWPAVKSLLAFEARASAERVRLGLDPLSRARLDRDQAAVEHRFDVPALVAEGRQALAARNGGE